MILGLKNISEFRFFTRKYIHRSWINQNWIFPEVSRAKAMTFKNVQRLLELGKYNNKVSINKNISQIFSPLEYRPAKQ